MEKRRLKRRLFFSIMLLACVAILGGCKTNGKKTYKKRDVAKYLDTRFNKKDYTLSKQSKDSWTVKLKGVEGISFELIKDEVTYSGWGIVTYHFLESNIDYYLTPHYLEQYRIEYPDEYEQLSLRMEINPGPYYSNIVNAVENKKIYVQAACPMLNFTISSRAELMAVIDSLEGFIEYLEQQPYVSGFYYTLLYQGGLPDFAYKYRSNVESKFSSLTAYPWHRNLGLEGTYGESILNEVIFDREKLIDEWDFNLVYPYARWQLGAVDYSDEEIASILEKNDQRHTLAVERPDGSIARWSDLLHTYSNISIGVLYEVLQREGILLLEGDKPDEPDKPAESDQSGGFTLSVGSDGFYIGEIEDGFDDGFTADDGVNQPIPLINEAKEPDYYTYFSWIDEDGDEHLIKLYNDYQFDYLMNGEIVVSDTIPEISLEYFQSMTGLKIYQKD